MGLFSRLFGKGSDKPERPDDYYLASAIASTIDGYVATQGFQSLLHQDTAIGVSNDYRVFLSQAIESVRAKGMVRAFVYLRDLKTFADYKRTTQDPVLGPSVFSHIATDQLAYEALANIKKQLGE